MDFVEILGLSAGLCTSISSLPQLIKIAKEKKADDVSSVMYFVLLAGVSLWVVYGFKKDDLPILITNIASLIINLVLLVLRYKYAKKD